MAGRLGFVMRVTIFAVIAVLAVSIVIALGLRLISPASAGVSSLGIGSATVAAGADVTVALTANAEADDGTADGGAGDGIGAWQVTVAFDTANLTYASCAVVLPPGTTAFCDNPSPGIVRFTGASSQGLIGAIELGTVTFTAGPVTGTYPLDATALILADPAGIDIQGVTAGDGTITITLPTPTPASTPTPSPSPTATPTPFPTPSPTPKPTLTPPPPPPTPFPTPPSSPSPTPQPDFTVDSTVDAPDSDPGNGECASSANVCTLRAAIMEANATPGENRIAVPAGAYTLSIAGMGEDAAATGDLDVTDNLVLTGAGVTLTAVQACEPAVESYCNGVDRVFDVDPASQGIAVALSGLTVQRGVAWPPGYPRPEEGGGIRSRGNLSITGLIIAYNNGAIGAGISSMGNLSISYSTVAQNDAGGWDSTAGGISSNGTATIDHVIIANNAAEQLGGIWTQGSTTITNSVVTGNRSTGLLYPGAAGISANGSLTVSNTNVSDNDGGGIYWHGFLRVTDSTITGNTDREGIFNWVPGGKLQISDTQDLAVVEGSTISGNAVFGVNIDTSTHMTLKRTTISSNGGGVASKGSLTIVDSTLSDNHPPSIWILWGGVGLVNNGTAALTNVTLSGNTATAEGAGIRNVANGTITILNSTIANNSGSPAGGIYNEVGGTVLMQNTIVAGNSGSDCSGVMVSNGHNIFSDGTCGVAGPGGDMPWADPLLGPLADNGGPTLTHALLADSLAIDAANDSACPFADQRRYSRVGVCDIGAYEFDGVAVTIKQGDVNCDSAVTAVDALAILRVVAKLPVTARCGYLTADVNCDGLVTAVDALLVLRSVAALPVNQKEPCANLGEPR